jgi:hypothetical protein
MWEDLRGGRRALLHNGGGKGYRALLYLIPDQDAGFFLAYNLADRHEDGELQEAFIREFRRRFMPPLALIGETAAIPGSAVDFTGEYLYVRRARTTPENMIGAINRVRIASASNGTLTMIGASGPSIVLHPLDAVRFRRADGRGVVAFDGIDANRPARLVALTDSGFPAVYERMPLLRTVRAQVVWASAMVLAFLYASVWRPLAAAVRGRRAAGWDSVRWSVWLAGVASALNLVFLAGFPLAFVGRIEGGVPAFLYGVPPLAAGLLFIPRLTAWLAVATLIALTGVWRSARVSPASRTAHTLVACALVAFIAFMRYWRTI